MTTYRQGDTATLVAEFFEFEGGPAVDVANLTITITPLSGGVAVLATTSVGITHPATGVYAYQYAISGAIPVGQYLVRWAGDDDAVATEVITVVVAASASTSYCDGWEPTFTCELPTGSAAVSGIALQVASEVLYALSGRQFGLCTVTRRPCRSTCYGDTWPIVVGSPVSGGTYPTPALYAGEWYNITCGSCGSDCSCSLVSEITLPGPVFDVLQVKVDGEVLTPNVDYRLDDWRLLVRLGGLTWPLCNDLNLADTEDGTWSVTYRAGQPLPQLGKIALGVLTDEFTKALLCNDDCRLPKPVQSLSRQGVDITFLDPNEVFQAGRTGLYIPDLFITTVNPHARLRRARVYDIDNPQRYRQLGTG
jgi:hypothetical protein